MSLLLGLLLGAGLALVFTALATPRRTPTRRPGALRLRLDRAGLERVSAPLAVAVAGLGALLLALLTWALTHAAPVALAVGAAGALVPWWWLAARHQARLRRRRADWPDVVDHLRSAVRAGLPLSEALAQLGTVGPAELRAPFAAFAADLRVARGTDQALEALRERLADPVADRVVAAVHLTRQVGGADVGEMLSTLSGFLRDELRTRGELEARQSWTVNAARLAVAAPWIILVILCFEPRIAAAYTRPAGILVLALGALVAALSYRWMLRVARLDHEAPAGTPAPEAVGTP
ncbi:type II secretion system F family protein [Galactobacter valiniphilus]|uniref:type II secretion system F family protein n=1 Tax=Galactobacter valiniphilus TaxID=2676122 RepID=UPI003736D528